MEGVTWVGTIASVLGLGAAIWAAVKAQTAAVAAGAARQEVRNLQAPWRLHDLEAQLRVLREMVVSSQWEACESIASICMAQVSEFMEHFKDGLDKEALNLLQTTSVNIGTIENVALRCIQADGLEASFDKEIAERAARSAIENVARVRGALMRRAGG